MNGFEDIATEFSRPFAIEDIEREGSELVLEATDDERRRLAARFGLLAIDRLRAELTLTRGASGIPIRVRGVLAAAVVQECVVSLDPVASEITEPVDVEYGPAAADGEEAAFNLDQPDPPEPLDGDTLELGELLAQHLSVALDPYPRKEGAAPIEWDGTGSKTAGNEGDSPFAVLARLRKKGS